MQQTFANKQTAKRGVADWPQADLIVEMIDGIAGDTSIFVRLDENGLTVFDAATHVGGNNAC